jgi:teichuronic acid biosynthesis glycosyltransferase TuaG
MKNKLVSIITPVYNSSKFFEETAKSVLNQTYTDWEWIIVDDLSTDNSIEIIEKFTEIDTRIKLIKSKENLGSGFSRNIATKQAKGIYIAFLDSDDLWDENKLEVQLSFMQKHNYAFSYTSYRYINELGVNINKPYLVSKTPINYNYLLKNTDIGCLTVIYDSSILGKRDMTKIKRKQDYALWLEILKEGNMAYPVNSVLASYRVRKGSNTSNKFNLIFSHYIFLRQTQKLNFIKSLFYTFHWGIKGLNKFFFAKLKL